MMSLPEHFRSREVTSGHVTSTCELQPGKTSNVPKTWLIGLLQPLPGDFWSIDVTSGHVVSGEVISCHVTSTSSQLQPRWSSNEPKTWLVGFLQPLPGDFRSIDVTSGDVRSLELICCHVTATSCEFSAVGAQTYQNLAYRPSTATSG